MSQSTRVTLGKIIGLYGLHGWVKVYSYTDPIANILNYSPWQLYHHGQWQTVTIAEGKLNGKRVIAHLESGQDRDQAAQLLGAEIAVYREQLPPLAPGEYYWLDLIGFTVINTKRIILGKVHHLLETGANDVFVVTGERERLIPFLWERVVITIDFPSQLITVDWEEDF